MAVPQCIVKGMPARSNSFSQVLTLRTVLCGGGPLLCSLDVEKQLIGDRIELGCGNSAS